MSDQVPAATGLSRRLIQTGYLLALIAGFAYGYLGGVRISGPGLGVVMGANTAMFGAMLVGYLSERALRWTGSLRSA